MHHATGDHSQDPIETAVRARAAALMTPGMEVIDCDPVTPLALPADLPLWIDAAVMARERIVVGGGSRSAKVVGPPAMLLELGHAEVVEGLARPIEP